jgi:hypothetical protein
MLIRISRSLEQVRYFDCAVWFYPTVHSHNIELIPISSNESFQIDYNVTRGIQMEFNRNNKIVDKQESPEQQIIPQV